ncbi:MAG: hypothetical protein ABI321_02400 [Polyangia bacterium]
MSSLRAVIVSLVCVGGCASGTNPKLLYGTYDVQVTAFGKTDPDIVTVSEGNGALILDFNYGFYTDSGAVNASGIRAKLSDRDLKIASQPIHVEHSTGSIDGTVTGQGTADGASLTLTLNVLPVNFAVPDPSGGVEPAGSTVDYTLTGTKQ